MNRFEKGLKGFLLACVAGLIFLPTVFMVSTRVKTGSWTRPGNLDIKVAKRELPEFDLKGWVSGEFQSGFAAWFNQNFGLRDAYVRIYNQLLYSAFRQSRMLNGDLVIGKGDWLFERPYLEEYFRATPLLPRGRYEEQADLLAALDRSLTQNGRQLIVLVTPSKASFHSDLAPSGREGRGPGGLRARDILIPSLRKRGVKVLDAASVLAGRDSLHETGPFSKGGTHWNNLAASLVMQDLARLIGKNWNRPTPQLEVSRVTRDLNPVGSDRDLASMLNLIFRPMRYPATHVTTAIRDPQTPKPVVAFVGNSFQWNFLPRIFSPQGRLFEKTYFAYYFHDLYESLDCGGSNFQTGIWDLDLHHIWKPITDSQWWDGVRSADAVVVEFNEGTLDQYDYWERFCKEAIPRLEQLK